MFRLLIVSLISDADQARFLRENGFLADFKRFFGEIGHDDSVISQERVLNHADIRAVHRFFVCCTFPYS